MGDVLEKDEGVVAGDVHVLGPLVADAVEEELDAADVLHTVDGLDPLRQEMPSNHATAVVELR